MWTRLAISRLVRRKIIMKTGMVRLPTKKKRIGMITGAHVRSPLK
jgi:hypothetical protein